MYWGVISQNEKKIDDIANFDVVNEGYLIKDCYAAGDRLSSRGRQLQLGPVFTIDLYLVTLRSGSILLHNNFNLKKLVIF